MPSTGQLRLTPGSPLTRSFLAQTATHSPAGSPGRYRNWSSICRYPPLAAVTGPRNNQVLAAWFRVWLEMKTGTGDWRFLHKGSPCRPIAQPPSQSGRRAKSSATRRPRLLSLEDSRHKGWQRQTVFSGSWQAGVTWRRSPSGCARSAWPRRAPGRRIRSSACSSRSLR